MVKLKSKRPAVAAVAAARAASHGDYGSLDLNEGTNLLQERLARREVELQLQLLDRQEALIKESITFFGDTTLNTETPGFDGEGPYSGGFLLQTEGQEQHSSDFAFRNLEELRRIRSRSRYLATYNEFAIGGLSNIINYTIGGYGLQWRVQTKRNSKRKLTDEEKTTVQSLVDTFQKANKWPGYEREYVTRAVRDGETFTRFFAPEEDCCPSQVRFMEPGLIQQPAGATRNNEFGILTVGQDVETVIAYFKRDDELDTIEKVPATEVIHTKMFVDRNSKRGLPGFFPVEKNLNRAEKLLRNMSAMSAIQAAIAMIRKHNNYSKSAVSAFADDQKDFQFDNTLTGKTEKWQQIGPGEILDAPKGIDYEFPATNSNSKDFVTVLQAELRAVAARFNMPEFMFTQDASNNNFASTLVAEGPAVKSFESWQGFIIGELKSVMHMMLDIEVRRDLLSEEINELVTFQVTAPKIEIRDRLKLAKAYEIEKKNGVLSTQTWTEQLGLNYDAEQANIEEHTDLVGDDDGGTSKSPPPEDDDDDDDDET